ncbi:MAG: hypothetical protein LBL46_00685 [Rickettsiales bacterium]|jgi:hypothetical protein|nr:hypothetical protein [Rickettsiales bacterium]
MKLQSLISGGQLAGKKIYIMAATGILAALGAYLAGDADLFGTAQAVWPLAAVYFLQKGISDGK